MTQGFFVLAQAVQIRKNPERSIKVNIGPSTVYRRGYFGKIVTINYHYRNLNGPKVALLKFEMAISGYLSTIQRLEVVFQAAKLL